MATGRVDVTRREDVNFSSRNRCHGKNRYHDLGYSCDYYRNSSRGSGRKGVDGNRGKRTYYSEISRSEDEGSIPATKRSKISPIPRGREEKDVRISSKNRIVEKNNPRLSSPPQPKSGGRLDSVVDNASKKLLATNQHQGKLISSAESCLDDGSESNFESDALTKSPSLLSPEFQSKNSGVNEGTEIRKISMSRWAYEEGSPSQNCTSNDRSNSPSKRMEVDTPESGEFRVDIYENNQSLDHTSGSDCLDDADRHGSVESCLGSDVENDHAAPEPRSVNMLQSSRSVCVYEKLGKISEGTYGVVYKARDKETGEIVALKKVKMERVEGFPLTALREINLLLALHHSSIIDVKEVVMDRNADVYMVMEYMEYDLMKLMKVMQQPFTEKEVKCLMLQLLEGIKDLHDNWILHRDLKTSNILISKNGKLKICDFGMSRQYGSPLKPLTPLVVTLWYRAPELLLGEKQYSTAVDMWSVGCIMAELLAKKPFFDGDSEVRQIDKIYKTLGTPTLMTWPGLADLPGYKATFANQPRNKLRERFPALSFNGSPVLSDRGFDLLSQLLTYDPDKRITVDEALAHGWFKSESKQELRFAQDSLAQKIKTLTYGY